jgi:hypothetical protein
MFVVRRGNVTPCRCYCCFVSDRNVNRLEDEKEVVTDHLDHHDDEGEEEEEKEGDEN